MCEVKYMRASGEIVQRLSVWSVDGNCKSYTTAPSSVISVFNKNILKCSVHTVSETHVNTRSFNSFFYKVKGESKIKLSRLD